MIDALQASALLLAALAGFALSSFFSKQRHKNQEQQYHQTVINLAVAKERLTQLKLKEDECHGLQQQLLLLKTENADLNARQQGATQKQRGKDPFIAGH